jgi:tetratricopeptide (TPR) repeat protein
MQDNPYKLEEPPEKPKSKWTFKLTRRSGLYLALVVLAGAHLYFTNLLYKRVTKTWPTVSYIDCVFYPFREKAIHKKQGAYLFGMAQNAERRGLIPESLGYYLRGLKLIPSSWAIRLKLVRMSLKEGRGYGMSDLLREGMEVSSHENRYMDAVVNIAWEIKDYSLMIEACDVAMKAAMVASGQEARISGLIEKKALALVENGEPAKAIASLPEIAEGSPVESVIDRITLLLRLQLPVDTISFIEKWEHRYPRNVKLLRLLARSQREINDLEGMEETMAKCIASNPDAREAWSAVVVNRALTSDIAGARDAMEKYFVKFYGNPDHLLVLGLDLALIGNRVLLAECIAESNLHGYAGIELKKLLVEMEVNRSSWESSKKLLDEIAAARRQLGIPADSWYLFYNSFCEAALSDQPERQRVFLEILREEKSISSADALESFIRLLSLEGRYGTAEEITQLARSRFPEYRDWLQYVRQFESK